MVALRNEPEVTEEEVHSKLREGLIIRPIICKDD